MNNSRARYIKKKALHHAEELAEYKRKSDIIDAYMKEAQLTIDRMRARDKSVIDAILEMSRMKHSLWRWRINNE